MRGWKYTQERMSHEGLKAAAALEKMVEGTRLSADVIDEAEYHIAFWYMQVFALVYNRLPILPHRRFT